MRLLLIEDKEGIGNFISQGLRDGETDRVQALHPHGAFARCAAVAYKPESVVRTDAKVQPDHRSAIMSHRPAVIAYMCSASSAIRRLAKPCSTVTGSDLLGSRTAPAKSRIPA